jgi:hypothetical protein
MLPAPAGGALPDSWEQAMLGRNRRQERREERREARGGGPEVTRYQMRQRMLSIGDDYVIENDRGERVFKWKSRIRAGAGWPWSRRQ